MTTNNERERELFEEWYEADAMPCESDWFKRDEDGDYANAGTDSAWGGFLAGRELLRAEYETKLAEAQANSSNDAQEALRYRWIRNQKESLYYLIGGAIESMGMVDLADFPQFDELDAAVDAQLKDAGWEVSKDTSAIERVKIRAKVEALEEAAERLESHEFVTSDTAMTAYAESAELRRMAAELKAKL